MRRLFAVLAVTGFAWAGFASAGEPPKVVKDIFIPVNEEAEVGNLPALGGYSLLQGDSTFLFNRKGRTLTKITLGEDRTLLSGVFAGDDFFCVLANRSLRVEGLFKYSMKTQKAEKLALDPAMRAAYSKTRWAREHQGSAEGFQEGKGPGIEEALRGVTLIHNKLYIGVQDTGLLEFDPGTGANRLLAVLATAPEGGGGFMNFSMPLPAPAPLALGNRLFWFSPLGPVFLDQTTGRWALLVAKGGLDNPEIAGEFDTTGGNLYPLELSFENYMTVYATVAFGGLGRPLEKGAVYFNGGLFLSDGVLKVSVPWDPKYTSEDVTNDLASSALAVGNEVWISKRGACREDTQNHLFRTTDLGATWKEAPLTDLSKTGLSCALVDVAEDAVVLLVHDRAKPEGDYLLIRPRSALLWGPVPKALCSGLTELEGQGGDDEPMIVWKTQRLWTTAPDPNTQAPALKYAPEKPKEVSPLDYCSGAKVGDYAVYTRTLEGQTSTIVKQIILVETEKARLTEKRSDGHEMVYWMDFGKPQDPKTLIGKETVTVAGKGVLCDVFQEEPRTDKFAAKEWLSHEVGVGGLVRREIPGYSSEILTEYGNRPLQDH